MDAQAIQKQQVDLQNAIRLGHEAQKNTALREEDKAKIRMHVGSLKNQWQSLEERMKKKVKRYFNENICHWKYSGGLMESIKQLIRRFYTGYLRERWHSTKNDLYCGRTGRTPCQIFKTGLANKTRNWSLKGIVRPIWKTFENKRLHWRYVHRNTFPTGKM